MIAHLALEANFNNKKGHPIGDGLFAWLEAAPC
jgi:hypothetical protein